MRLALAVLSAGLVSLAASDSSADETPPKAGAGKALRVDLAAGKTYRYRLTQNMTERMGDVPGVPDGAEVEFLATTRDVVWEAGISLQRVEADGNLIVSLLPERVHGATTHPLGEPEKFDSDDPKNPSPCRLLGRGIRVKLSPAGRVLEAEVPAMDGKVLKVAEDGTVNLRDLPPDPGFVKPFAQQFFHELPDAAPRAGLEWDQTRALAPDWFVAPDDVVGLMHGDVEEKSTVTKAAPDAVTANFRARGKREVKVAAKPLELNEHSTEEERKASLPQLKEWHVLGEVRFRRDTGLVASRTWTTTVVTFSNALRLPKADLPAIVGVKPEDVSSPGGDTTHEIKSQLDLVEVR